MTPTEAQVKALVYAYNQYCVMHPVEGMIEGDERAARYVLALTEPLLHALEQCAAGAFVVSDRERLTNVAKAALAAYRQAVPP